FEKLDYDTQRRIANAMVAREVASQVARHGFELSANADVVDAVIKLGYHDRLGARPMRDATELLVRNALAAELLFGGQPCGRLCSDAHGRLRVHAAAQSA